MADRQKNIPCNIFNNFDTKGAAIYKNKFVKLLYNHRWPKIFPRNLVLPNLSVGYELAGAEVGETNSNNIYD